MLKVIWYLLLLLFKSENYGSPLYFLKLLWYSFIKLQNLKLNIRSVSCFICIYKINQLSVGMNYIMTLFLYCKTNEIRNQPPKESWRSLVSLESLYGTWRARFDLSPRADITFPRASKPQLMEIPSLARSPVAPVRFSLSEPARSTKWNLALNVTNSWLDPLSSIISNSSSFWKM